MNNLLENLADILRFHCKTAPYKEFEDCELYMQKRLYISDLEPGKKHPIM